MLIKKIYSKYIIARENDLSSFDFFKRIYHSLVDSIFFRLTLWRVCNDRELAMVVHGQRAKRKIKKIFRDRLLVQTEVKTVADFPKIIWWSWLQGENEAPELAKVCLESLRKNFPDYKIVIVTNDNLDNYVKLPQTILDKFNAGWIKGAHFADIIRLNLLAKYGGVWIDATVFCTDNSLMKIIEKNDMFVYQNLFSQNKGLIKMSNWLIASKKGNPYIVESAEILTSYFEKSCYLDDYFICHIIMSIVSEKYPDIWNKMPVYNNTDPHMLQLVIMNKFSEEQYLSIVKRASFHKLNRHLLLTDSEYYLYIKHSVGM
ncbi:capsular polysaccharide synthesis protein [Ligilactobacillus agilis]|uniref:Capsular polysaccharide synthesis protein n=1 Tax=Ligilactobacillus agilis TaxID=1601 RepID=A0A6F9Y6K8_9LACO|nr:capsular polysaccharide synthesis protein [Ligilactobacillus agilis]GET13136.1 capsular polysaccharide synthesis protein [Ligilactobacillus agilis]